MTVTELLSNPTTRAAAMAVLLKLTDRCIDTLRNQQQSLHQTQLMELRMTLLTVSATSIQVSQVLRSKQAFKRLRPSADQRCRLQELHRTDLCFIWLAIEHSFNVNNITIDASLTSVDSEHQRQRVAR
jgi:hypothetical protein